MSLADKLNETNSTVWAHEGYEHATKFVYNITEGTLPSEEYIKGGQKLVEHQLALGGYRLADLLTRIFKKSLKAELFL